MRFNPVKIITDGDMSDDVNSIGLDLNQHVLYSIQAVWTGSPVGTLKLQISNDIVLPAVTAHSNLAANPAANVVNWSDYSGSTSIVSGAGNFTWNVFDVGYRWVRLVYTSTSGTGTINASFCGKAI